MTKATLLQVSYMSSCQLSYLGNYTYDVNNLMLTNVVGTTLKY